MPEVSKAKFSFIVLDHLHKGQIIGEHSAINGTRDPYVVVVQSKVATVFKINMR